ncbi:cytochrome P450 [Herbidospora sp. RD11066]
MTHTLAREVTALVRRARSGDPYPAYAALREMGPLLPTLWGGLLATDHATCRAVLTGPEFLVPDPAWRDTWVPGWRDRPSLHYAGRTMMQLNPPEHTTVRTAALPGLSPRALARLEAEIERLAVVHLDALDRELASHGRADFARLVGDPLAMAVMCALLGLPPDDAARLADMVREVSAALELFPTHDELDAADRATGELGAYLAGRAFALDVDDLLAATLLLAGWHTTASALSSLVEVLAADPDRADWLRADPGRLDGAVAEVLRHDPLIQVVSRYATRDTVVAGQAVAAGQVVHLLIGSAHRDPALLDDPDRLDLTRAPVRGLTFGHGPHYCVGARLAQLQSRVVLRLLLDRPPLTVAGPVLRRGFVFTRVTALPVGVHR